MAHCITDNEINTQKRNRDQFLGIKSRTPEMNANINIKQY